MGRLALITGGSRGIGLAIREQLEHQDCQVLAPTRAELNLGSPESVQAFLTTKGHLPIDILINNAAINILNPIPAIDAQTWVTMVQTNLTAALSLIQAFAPGMASRGWGRILSLSSILSIVTRENRAAYSMTKAAINALTRSVAVEYGSAGVIVNALAPGYVHTELTKSNNTPETLDAIRANIPMRRLADPKELALVAGFLVSEDNTYLTGQTIIVDGGFTSQ